MNLDERIKDVEARNVKINEEIKTLGERRAEIDRQMSALRDEAIKTIGEHKALVEMKADETPITPVELVN
jgi:uncharacterized coiled-coil DUF342 family protein